MKGDHIRNQTSEAVMSSEEMTIKRINEQHECNITMCPYVRPLSCMTIELYSV